MSELIWGPSLWALRFPVLVLGFLVIVLNDRRLAGAEATFSSRWLAALALGFCPWQGFSGSILHPDNYLLAAILILILAMQHNRIWLAAFSVILAVLAKPTGILFLPVGWWLAGSFDNIRTRELWATRAIILASGLFLALTMKWEMIQGIADFGRFSTLSPLHTRPLAMAGATLFLGGPLLAIFSWSGTRQRLQTMRSESSKIQQREARASLAAAGILLLVFIAAVLARGQFKGNWVLPALVLLWPTRLPGNSNLLPKRMLVQASIVLVFLVSLGQTLIMVRPDLMQNIEKSLAEKKLIPAWISYSTQAGVRETAVSSSRTWSDHLHEYDDLSAFVRELKTAWDNSPISPQPLDWIVSTDYGLACQVHWYLGRPEARVVILEDGVFHRTRSELRQLAPQGPLLMLDPGRSAVPFLKTHPLAPMPHPVTGKTLHPFIATLIIPKPEEHRHVVLP